MSSNWPTINFGDAPLAIIDGDRGANYPNNAEFSANGYCLFLNTGNVRKEGFSFGECAFITESKDRLLRKGKLLRGDVVLTTRGTIGNVGYFDSKVKYENIRINSGMVILRTDEAKLLPYYLFLFLRTDSFSYQVKSLQTGSAQPQLPIKDLVRVEIPIPPITEQEKVRSLILPIDDRIALLRETNATLEAIAQALFKSWFVDFDPVRAKAERREPEGVPAEVADLFPSDFEDTELGEIPKGWRAGTLSEIITESVSKVGNEVANVLSAVQTGNLVQSSDHFQKRVHSESISKYKRVAPLSFAYNPSRINIGSIGINETGTLGAVSPIYVAFGAKSDEASYYIWHQLRRDKIKKSIVSLCSGTVRQSLSFRDFASIQVVLPDERILKIFYEYRIAFHTSISSNIKEIETLVSIRDTLLPRLMSGKLRIPDLEEQAA